MWWDLFKLWWYCCPGEEKCKPIVPVRPKPEPPKPVVFVKGSSPKSDDENWRRFGP